MKNTNAYRSRNVLITGLRKKNYFLGSGSLVIALLLFFFFATTTTTTYTVINTLDSGAGSLREAIVAANSSPDAPNIEFNIATSDPNYSAATGVWTISLSSPLPQITKSGTQILGFSQAANQGDRNPGVLGSGGTVGVDKITLPQYPRPEIALQGGGNNTMISFSGAVSDVLVEGICIYNIRTAIGFEGGAGTGRKVRNCIIGLLPDGSDPGLSLRVTHFAIQQNSGGAMRVDSCYIGYVGRVGILGAANTSEVHASYNEVFGVGWGSNAHDGIDINGIDGTVNCNLIYNCTTSSGARSTGGGNGVELGSQTAGTGNNLVENNTIFGNISAGIVVRKGASFNIIRKNIIHNNETGILGNDEGRQTISNQFRQNLIYQNNGLSIDNTGLGSSGFDQVTPNDGLTNSSAFNDDVDYPVITSASISGSSLNVIGYVGTSSSHINGVSTLDFFKAEDDGNNFGEVEKGDGMSVSHGEARFYIDSCQTLTSGEFSCALTIPGSLSLSDGDKILSTATSSSNNTSELGGVFEIGGSLPVELVSFSVEGIDDFVLLKWGTASELNSDFFQVERSIDKKEFSNIGSVKAAGNSDQTMLYSFRDLDAQKYAAYSNVFYRLKGVDFDGSFEYSEIKSFSLDADKGIYVTLLGNPVKDMLRLSYVSGTEESLNIRVLSINGEEVFSGFLSGSVTAREWSIPIDQWADGVYTLTISNQKELINRKFVVAK